MRVLVEGSGGPACWPQPGCRCESCLRMSGNPRARSTILIDGLVRLGMGGAGAGGAGVEGYRGGGGGGGGGSGGGGGVGGDGAGWGEVAVCGGAGGGAGAGGGGGRL